MGGKKTAYEGVPFFRTRQFDVGLLHVGHAKHWDQILYRGTVARHDFLAFIDGGRVMAAAGMNRDQEMAAIEELMRLNQMPRSDQLTDPSMSFRERLKAIRALKTASPANEIFSGHCKSKRIRDAAALDLADADSPRT